MPTQPLKREPIQLYQIFKIWYDSETTDLDITLHSETLYSNTEVLWTMMYHWSEYYYCGMDPMENMFKALWKQWIRTNGENLYRQYKALYADYDPIANYNMTESAADGRKKDKNEIQTQPTGKTVTETQQDRNAIGSAAAGDPLMHTKTEQTYENAKSTQTETPTNTQSMSFYGSTLTGYHEATEHYLQRKGKIGTTTSMDMIRSEVEGRRTEETDLLYDFIKRFIDRYCYYVG